MSAILVYLHRRSSQVIRVTHNIKMPPAVHDDVYFVYQDTSRMPPEIVAEEAWHKLEYVFHHGKFILSSFPVDMNYIQKLNSKLECIERLQGMVNRLRNTKIPNLLVGAQDLDLLYSKEIEDYNLSGNIGPLLSSKVNDDTSVDEFIAEYTIKKDSYKDMLTRTEMLLNKYLPKIKKSDNPYSILNEIQENFGLNFGPTK